MQSDDVVTLAVVVGVGYLIFQKQLAPAVEGVSNAVGAAGNATAGVIDAVSGGAQAYTSLLSKPFKAISNPLPDYTPQGYPNTIAGLQLFAKNAVGSLVGRSPNTSTLAGPVYTPPPSPIPTANFQSVTGAAMYVPPPNISKSFSSSSSRKTSGVENIGGKTVGITLKKVR